MAQLPGLIYAQGQDELFVNLFIGSEASLKVGNTPLRIAQQTDYPWQGRVTISVDLERPVDFTLAVRIPGWSRGTAMPGDLYRYAEEDPGRPDELGRLKSAPTKRSESVGAG